MFKPYSSNELEARVKSLIVDTTIASGELNISDTLTAGHVQSDLIDGAVIRTKDNNGQWQKIGAAGTYELPRDVEFSTTVYRNLEDDTSNVFIDSDEVTLATNTNETIIKPGFITIDGNEINPAKIQSWDTAAAKNEYEMDVFKLNNTSKSQSVKFQMSGLTSGSKVIKMDSYADNYVLPKQVGANLCLGEKCELKINTNKTQVGQSEFFQGTGISIGSGNSTLVDNRNIILGDGHTTTTNNEMILGDSQIVKTRLYGVGEYNPEIHTNPVNLALDGTGELIKMDKPDKTEFTLSEFTLTTDDGLTKYSSTYHKWYSNL